MIRRSILSNFAKVWAVRWKVSRITDPQCRSAVIQSGFLYLFKRTFTLCVNYENIIFLELQFHIFLITFFCKRKTSHTPKWMTYFRSSIFKRIKSESKSEKPSRFTTNSKPHTNNRDSFHLKMCNIASKFWGAFKLFSFDNNNANCGLCSFQLLTVFHIISLVNIGQIRKSSFRLLRKIFGMFCMYLSGNLAHTYQSMSEPDDVWSRLVINNKRYCDQGVSPETSSTRSRIPRSGESALRNGNGSVLG